MGPDVGKGGSLGTFDRGLVEEDEVEEADEDGDGDGDDDDDEAVDDDDDEDDDAKTGEDWGLAICNRVRSTSCGYVTSEAIIFENAEQDKIVAGDRDEWLPSGSDASVILKPLSTESHDKAVIWYRRMVKHHLPAQALAAS